MTYFVET